jgi:hypothetical protein
MSGVDLLSLREEFGIGVQSSLNGIVRPHTVRPDTYLPGFRLLTDEGSPTVLLIHQLTAPFIEDDLDVDFVSCERNCICTVTENIDGSCCTTLVAFTELGLSLEEVSLS